MEEYAPELIMDMVAAWQDELQSLKGDWSKFDNKIFTYQKQSRNKAVKMSF